MFVTPAAGLGVMLAVLRGLRGDKDLGDFYVDLMRGLVFVLVPFCVVVALLLVANGVPMTFQGAAQATTLDGAATGMETQTIARGPGGGPGGDQAVGTNGGGFFGPNSTHPFENPTPWSNLFEVASILVLPMSTIVMVGLMLRNMRHAVVIYGVMLALLVAGVAVVAILAEVRARAPAHRRACRSRQGPEHGGHGGPARPGRRATWAAITTATSNGSVNSMHDSLNPIAGLVPMAHDDAQRRLQRHRRRVHEHADVHHHRRVHRRADGRAGRPSTSARRSRPGRSSWRCWPC